MLNVHIVRTTDSKFTMLCSYPNLNKAIFKLLFMSDDCKTGATSLYYQEMNEDILYFID